MLNTFLHRLVAGLMVVLLPAAIVSADAGTAMLNAGDRVLVNGKQAQGRQAILPGDTVQNVGTGDAVLSIAGGTVTVAKNSAVKYQDGNVRVTRGSANFQSEINAQYENVSVHPSNKDAQYFVGEYQGKRVIAAMRGSLLVSDGANEVLLPEGSALAQDKVPSPGASGAGVGASTTKNTDEQRGGKKKRAAGLPGWATVALIGGATAGVFGGLAAAGVFSSNPTSGSKP